MTSKRKTTGEAKPYLKGAPTDENTVRQCLKFFGMLIMVAFVSFIVCSMTSFQSVFLRIIVNLVIESLILMIFFAKGNEAGTEGVARGEIVYSNIQKGREVSEGEKRIPFHPWKGFIIGLFGTSVLLILAVILAVTAERQMTGAGTLPSWMDTYLRRSEIGDALAGYSQASPVSVTDIVRVIIRICIMPIISMIGAESRAMLLISERFSPVLILLPALSYAAGYLRGPFTRKKIHQEIATNNRKRLSREKKERKARKNILPKGPEQLN